MTVDYYKLNQIVTLIVAAMLNMVSSLNTASGSNNVTIDLTNMFFSIPISKDQKQQQFTLVWKG